MSQHDIVRDLLAKPGGVEDRAVDYATGALLDLYSKRDLPPGAEEAAEVIVTLDKAR